jgi:hypothetical protein
LEPISSSIAIGITFLSPGPLDEPAEGLQRISGKLNIYNMLQAIAERFLYEGKK